MTASRPEYSELETRLRQQLILAQVRVMELEDERDQLAPRVAELQQLLLSAQKVADQKIDEATHLAGGLAAAQADSVQLREHLQKISAEFATTSHAFAESKAQVERMNSELQQLHAASNERIAGLERQLSHLKSSFSWKCTAWLRSIAKLFGAKP